MNDVSEKLQAIRSKICNEALIVFAIIAIPALAISLYRATSIGWQPVMTMHIVVAATLWLTALFRGLLPYALRAGYLITAMLIVGTGGLWQFGLVAGSVSFLLAGAVLATILLGMRPGLAAGSAIILSVGAVGLYTVLEKRLPELDLVTYATNPGAWATLILGLLVTIGVLLAAVTRFNNFLISALTKTRQHEEELQESGREYRNILDNMIDTFYRADLEGCAVIASPSAMNLLGYSPEELIGRKLTDFYVDADRRTEFLEHLQESGGKVNDFEAKIYRKDGSWIWVSTNARFWKDADGNILGVEGVIRDITAYKETEDALRQSQKMEAVGHLAGGIAHDFNNLMGVMIGNAEMLRDKIGEDKKAGKNIEAIIQAVDRGSSLTDRILAFSRQQRLSPQPTALDDLVIGLETMLQRSLGETIELRASFEPETWNVLIDPHQFENALLNLTINARNAMLNGGLLSIETTNATLDETYTAQYEEVTPGDYVKISVRDTGTGMTAEVLENAFEPFFTTKEVGAGSGLGLSMVYGFVKQSNGHITIDSEVGQGTTVSLYLPRSKETDLKKTITHETPGQAKNSGRILVVEDDEFLRDIATANLGQQGYQIVEAGNGAEAIKALKSGQTFDLLFSDIVLPGGMNGLEIADEAKRIQPNIKVLFASGYSEDVVTLRGPLNQGETLLNKPYHRTDLLEKVRALLDSEED